MDFAHWVNLLFLFFGGGMADKPFEKTAMVTTSVEARGGFSRTRFKGLPALSKLWVAFWSDFKGFSFRRGLGE
jgi:hypothetical protein